MPIQILYEFNVGTANGGLLAQSVAGAFPKWRTVEANSEFRVGDQSSELRLLLHSKRGCDPEIAGDSALISVAALRNTSYHGIAVPRFAVTCIVLDSRWRVLQLSA